MATFFLFVRKADMRRLLQVFLCGLFLVALCASVQAGLIGPAHVGSNDPTDEGFGKDGTGFGTGVNDDGTLALRVDAPTTGLGRYRHNLTTAETATLESSAWVASATVRIPGANYLADQHNGVWFEVSYGTGASAKTYAVTMGTNLYGTAVLARVTDIEASGPPKEGIMYTGVPGALTYHVFEMKRDNPLSTDVKCYVDGTYEATIAPLTGALTEDLNRFVWGSSDGPSQTSADALWSGASLQTIPEPSTVALLATGVLGLLAYAWRKRK
jgi:hypothetical protein